MMLQSYLTRDELEPMCETLPGLTIEHAVCAESNLARSFVAKA